MGFSSAKIRSQTALLLATLSIIFLLWSAPWKALECGPDEGMEFSKMQLLLQRPGLAKSAWNDQSWFYSQVFAAVFGLTGFECGIPRLATFAIVIGLFFVFPRLMPKGTGWPHLVCAWLFFWCWPEMPHLAVSAMLEMPAIGLAVIAAAMTPRDRTEWRGRRFVCAGILFAIAVEIKLTALIVVPALVIKVLWLWWFEIRGRTQAGSPMPHLKENRPWLGPACGCAAFTGLCFVIALWSPNWDWSQHLGSHFAAGSTAAASKFRLEPHYLLQSPGTLIAAVLGTFMLWRKRRLPEVLFALGMLVTVCLVFFIHRPWWYYYGVHFAIPLAILGGWSTAELLKVAMPKTAAEPSALRPVFSPELSMMLGALALSLWAGCEFSRGYQDTLEIRQEERLTDNDSLNEIKKYQGKVQWIFTQNNLLAAQAGYVLPPELTILAKKRYWAGSVNDQMILDTVKHYDCEILIIYSDRELKQKAWNQFVETGYVKTLSVDNECVFVAKRLHPAISIKREDLLKQLGI